MADVAAVFDLPYPQARLQLKKVERKPEKDIVENPAAILTAVFYPALSKVYNNQVKAKTHSNAVRAAVDIYLIKAKTGKLPAMLPAGLPRGLFSNQPFEYEKTSDGFILRCRGKDLLKNKFHQYKFKLKKS